MVLKHDCGLFNYEVSTLATENDRQAYLLKKKLDKQGLGGDLFNSYIAELEKTILFKDVASEKIENLTVKITKLCKEHGIPIKKLDDFVDIFSAAIIDDRFPCLDCKKDTGEFDYYMVNDSLWRKLVPEDTKEEQWKENPNLLIFDHHFLCISCLQKRLGRRLTKADFEPYADLEINKQVFLHHCIK